MPKFNKDKKNFPSSTREWNNSIYAFNKNTVNLIPVISDSSIKLIKSYFLLYNEYIEKKIRKNIMRRRIRKLTSHRIYLSNGEFKHTNNKVIITLYLFNRQKLNYKLKIKKLYFRRKKMYNKLKLYIKKKIENWKLKEMKRIQIYKINAKKNDKLNLKNKINKLYKIKLNIPIKFSKNKRLIRKFKILRKKSFIKLINFYKNNTPVNHKVINKKFKYINKHATNFYKKLVRRSFKKLNQYVFYKQLLYINRSKLNYTYLQYLKKYLERMYNKNIEFNIVNLKRFYLNSDILSQSLSMKVTRKRKRLLFYLKKIKTKIKVPKIKQRIKELKASKFKIFNYGLIKQLKYRYVTGFRIEAKGRLTKRYTASRSVSKIIYKGNLINRNSSYRGLSTTLLKGYSRSNLQYTKLKSKTRIGSFGMKGWISSN